MNDFLSEKPTYIDALDRLRSKLIDLSNKNRLLNFRHNKRSSLRIVDELPDSIAGKLLNGKELKIIPVPAPSIKEEDLFGVQSKTISVKDMAELYGIDINLEVPLKSSEDELKHSDNKLQTNLFPVDLEKNLNKISSDARLAIEEKGINMLYIALGFLEWYEAPSSDQAHIAPLFLIPIILEKNGYDAINECHKYSVRYSDEDIIPNASLQEKLKKDFDIDLPDIDEEDTPEIYFEKVQDSIKMASRWKIRRHATISLFHFSNILMYNDLSSENKIITGSGLINQLFSEADKNEVANSKNIYDSKNYELDRDTTPQIPLVYDADSSQYQVLLDAKNGKNLVVEGPPGTGKSQTITNLIAASLAENKTVLFVSEKLAALEVVRNKLDKVGLGDFCLELHSHKTQKRRILDDLAIRLKKRNSLAINDLSHDIEICKNAKKRLNNYAKLINSKYGATDKSINEILCAAVHYEKLVNSEQNLVKNINIDSPEEVDSLYLSKIKETVKNYSASFENLNNEVLPNCNIWYGVNATNLNSLELDLAESLLSDCYKKGVNLRDSISAIATSEKKSLSSLRNVLESYFCIVSNFNKFPKENIAWDLVGNLFTSGSYRTIKIFIDEFKDVKYHLQLLRQISFKNLDLSKQTENKNLTFLSNLNSLNMQGHCLCNMQKFLYFYKFGKEKFNSLKKMNEKVGEIIQKRIPFSFRGIKFSVNLAKLFKQIPENAFIHRSLLESAESEILIKGASLEAQKLIQEKKRLEKHLDFSQIISVNDLRKYTSEMQTADFFSFLSSDYRKAKKFYKLLFKSNSLSLEEKIQYCTEAIELKEKIANFENSEKYKTILKNIFVGLDTDFEEYKSFYTWKEQLNSFISEYLSEDTEQIVKMIFAADFKEIKSVGNNNQIHSEEILENFKYVTFVDEANDFDIEEKLISKISYLENCLQIASDFNLDESMSYEDMKKFAQDYLVLFEKNKHLCANKLVKKILKSEKITIDSDIKYLHDTIDFSKYFEDLPEEIKNLFKDTSTYIEYRKIIDKIDNLSKVYFDFSSSLNSLMEKLKINPQQWMRSINQNDTGDILKLFKNCLDNKASLLNWSNYSRAANKCREVGLAYLIDKIENGSFEINKLFTAYQAALYNKLACQIIQEYPELRDFRGTEHNTYRETYAEKDQEIIRKQGKMIAHNAARRRIPVGNSRGRVRDLTELALIKHEIGKKRRHISIRSLIDRAGNAMFALKPVFMMGPYAIPQYLSSGKITFDVVIMDEASQMFPEYAIGALARAKQAIIVGDSKQLPPTSFFSQAQSQSDNEDEMFTIESGESILDTASDAFDKKRCLKWHYRSRHDSLISFSNKYFYDNELVVFPSVHVNNDNLGVKYKYIADGVCAKGKNPIEAQAVAKAIIDHFKNFPEETLGVATTNVAQMELIKDELERELRVNPTYRWAIESYEDKNEPFFVKNLENVQGDERDVIFISTAYGKAPDGSFSQRFGPINHETGWRRLNVLFTRARNKMVVFSSMNSKDISVRSGSPRGVVALKNYLDFAENGSLQQELHTGRAPDSPFEIQVINRLKQHGFECEPQIGAAGYFIDIGVYHPEHRGKFILGIECDGASYHSSKSARDRDRLREQVLRDQGWNIHRIWSTDWFCAPHNEIQKITKKINSICSAEIQRQTDDYNNTPQDELGGLTPHEAFQRNGKK